MLGPLTYLTSRRNGLVSVYSVSACEEGLMKSHIEPHILSHTPGSPVTPFRRSGTAFFRHPARQSHDSTVDMLELSSRGAIFGRTLVYQDSDDIPGEVTYDEVPDPPILLRNQQKDFGPLAAREHITLDLRELYEGNKLLSQPTTSLLIAYARCPRPK